MAAQNGLAPLTVIEDRAGPTQPATEAQSACAAIRKTSVTLRQTAHVRQRAIKCIKCICIFRQRRRQHPSEPASQSLCTIADDVWWIRRFTNPPSDDTTDTSVIILLVVLFIDMLNANDRSIIAERACSTSRVYNNHNTVHKMLHLVESQAHITFSFWPHTFFFVCVHVGYEALVLFSLTGQTLILVHARLSLGQRMS